MKSFSTLKLSAEMQANLKSLNYLEMRPIQEKAIPLILQGKDLLAQAKTGSGKTAAFGIGILDRLKPQRYRVQSLILCPTRELAEQVSGELRRLARFRHNIKVLCLTGGKPQRQQEHSLSHQAHIVVGTPGRIHSLLRRGSLNLDNMHTLVLDEADRMLDMGFFDEVKEIISYAPEGRQRLCFSATFPTEIQDLAKEIMKNPEEVVVESQHNPQDIEQHFYNQGSGDKADGIRSLLIHHQSESALIFCNTKEGCRQMSNRLNQLGISSLTLQGDMEQWERTETLIRFSNGSCPVLVATDVAARGLDISDLPLVINADLPFEKENYIHRIGRTGRAGKKGLAISLLPENHIYRLEEINELQQREYPLEDLPQLESESEITLKSPWVTLSINGGRRSKISAGDILGALTAPGGIKGKEVGKIDRLENLSYVAVEVSAAKKALEILQKNPIKGRILRAVLHR